MTLTVQDFFTIVTIIIGFQAFAVGLLVMIIKNNFRHSEDLCWQKKHSHQNLDYCLDALTPLINELETSINVHTGLMHNLCDASNLGSEMPNFSKIIHLRINSLRKAVQEFMLMSQDKNIRSSAVQQLSHSLGDTYTVELMEKASKFYPEDLIVEEGLRVLSDRLSG